MKALFPILICSAISAALGYYFGHITLPADSESSSGTKTTDSAFSPAPVAVQQTVQQPMQQTVQPAPVTPMTEPVPVAVAPEPAPIADPIEIEKNFAERAARTTHTLTDTHGRSIQASIIKVTEQDVKIRRADGLETMISLSMLSPEDVAFCNYLREQDEAKEETAPGPGKSDGFDWDSYFNS